MKRNVKFVLKEFLKLTEEEQKEIQKISEQYYLEKKIYNEKLNVFLSRVVGPIEQGECPCCNR